MVTQNPSGGTIVRPTDQVDHFDLLPFIAILMCTLGCLLLVTVGSAALTLSRPGEGWVPMPDSTRPQKTPVLIEWDGLLATIHRNGRKEVATWSRRPTVEFGGERYLKDEDGAIGQALTKLLDELQADASRYALIAVRPSGFENFDLFAYAFRRRKIDVGYEPVEQGRRIHLQLPRSAAR